MNAKVRHFCFETMCAGMCAVFLLLLMCSGCANLFNGQNDLPYDIAVAYTSPTTGIVYTAALDDDGVTLTGVFTTPDGEIFELSEDGTIVAADGKGNVITLTPKPAEG